MTSRIYPLSAIRTLALHAQGLAEPGRTAPAPSQGTIVELVKRLGCVQIDTLQMVQRSQYLVLWSRLGCYKPEYFDRLVYQPGERQFFEYWKHAAAIIPLEEYRYHLPLMRWFQEGNHHWNSDWLEKPGSRELVEHVRSRLAKEGSLRASDFKSDEGPRGTWWDWKPAKQALEYLFNTGEVMIANRVNFQRVYDLKERVLPEWVDTTEVTVEERDRFRVSQAVKALGVCEPAQAADYLWTRRTEIPPIMKQLIKSGEVVVIQGECWDNSVKDLVVHRQNMDKLEQAASGAMTSLRTTFLSPFDSLFWARGRDISFWNFSQTLEAYKRSQDRIWGYFCLPILYKDRLVGRFDPKLDRKNQVLHLKALHLEPGVRLEDEMITDIAACMRDFLEFHQADELLIEESKPKQFGHDLINAL